MKERINQLLQEIGQCVAATVEEAEALRIKYLSKKGEIARLFDDFRLVPSEEKKQIGQMLNELKNKAQEHINSLRERAQAGSAQASAETDLTRTSYPTRLGTRHPISLVKQEICEIFARLGFSIADGPEIEDDWHVFSSMNFAEDHPARDMQDTFFIEHRPDVILRTHTSSVQSRVMEKTQPPIRVICPGRTYRNEAISYRAHCFFHQVEALYVDKDVSFADLRQVLLYFLFPLYRTVCRDGHLLQYMWRQRLQLLQAYGMGGNTRMRHGGSQRIGQLRHRQQEIQRLCARYGYRTYHQS